MQKQAIIITDLREGAEYDSLLEKLGIKTRRKTLTVGDFILSGRLAVERKSRRDFEASIIDGRLFEQAKRLCSAYPRSALIVEGESEDGRVLRPALLGAYSALLCEHGLSIFFTKNPASTAELLSAMAKYEQISKKNPPRVHARRKALTLEASQRAVVEALPSAGPKLAKNLLAYFGTPLNVFNASEKTLCEVELMGKKRAKLVRKVLDSVYNCENE